MIGSYSGSIGAESMITSKPIGRRHLRFGEPLHVLQKTGLQPGNRPLDGQEHAEVHFYRRFEGPEDDALASRFNQALGTIRVKGIYDRIRQKYFNFDIYGE